MVEVGKTQEVKNLLNEGFFERFLKGIFSFLNWTIDFQSLAIMNWETLYTFVDFQQCEARLSFSSLLVSTNYFFMLAILYCNLKHFLSLCLIYIYYWWIMGTKPQSHGIYSISSAEQVQCGLRSWQIDRYTFAYLATYGCAIYISSIEKRILNHTHREQACDWFSMPSKVNQRSNFWRLISNKWLSPPSISSASSAWPWKTWPSYCAIDMAGSALLYYLYSF